jgi:hypothetical protein
MLLMGQYNNYVLSYVKLLFNGFFFVFFMSKVSSDTFRVRRLILGVARGGAYSLKHKELVKSRRIELKNIVDLACLADPTKERLSSLLDPRTWI